MKVNILRALNRNKSSWIEFEKLTAARVGQDIVRPTPCCTHLKTQRTCLEMFETSRGEGLRVFIRTRPSRRDAVEALIS